MAGYALLVGLTLLSVPALGQKKVQAIDAKIKNIEGDLEVLQEFLQEQSKTQAGLKKQLDGLDTLKGDLTKTDKKVEAVFDLTKKNTEEIATVSKRVDEDARRLSMVEEDLRKKVRFFGQIRVRPEFRSNQSDFNSQLDEDQNLLGNQRVRVGMSFLPVEGFEGRVVLQDARNWGVDSGDPDPADPMRLYEGYINATVDPDYASIKLGRQEWAFGAERLIGKSSWTQRGRSFDGMDLTLKYENFIKADVLYSLVNERNASAGEDTVFGGVYASSPYVEGMSIEGYLLYLHDNVPGAVRKVGTFGARLAGKLPVHPALFFDAEAALQFGTATESRRVQINATEPRPGSVIFETGDEDLPADSPLSVDNSHFAVMYYLEGGYTMPLEFPLSASAFIHLASGDGNTSPNLAVGNDQSTAFVPLYNTSHSLFGRMDMFVVSNIIDIGGRVKSTPVPGLDVLAEVHALQLYDASGALPLGKAANSSLVDPTDTYLGTVTEAEAAYHFNDAFTLSGGFGILWTGQAIVDRVFKTTEDYQYRSGDPASWVFTQADLVF